MCWILVAFALPLAADHAVADELVAGPDQWVQQLGDDSYTVRETASEQLVAAGAAAIAPLKRGAVSSDTEIAWRSRTILVEIGMAGDEAALAGVVKTADELASAGHAPYATLGEQVRRWREIRHLPAKEQIEQLNRYIFGGGSVDPVFFGILRGC